MGVCMHLCNQTEQNIVSLWNLESNKVCVFSLTNLKRNNWGVSRTTLSIYFIKDYMMGVCMHLCNQTEQNIVSLWNLESNKVCVFSLTNFIVYFNYCNLNQTKELI